MQPLFIEPDVLWGILIPLSIMSRRSACFGRVNNLFSDIVCQRFFIVNKKTVSFHQSLWFCHKGSTSVFVIPCAIIWVWFQACLTKDSLFAHVIYFCTGMHCWQAVARMNNIFKWANFVKRRTSMLLLGSFDHTGYSEHNDIPFKTIPRCWWSETISFVYHNTIWPIITYSQPNVIQMEE